MDVRPSSLFHIVNPSASRHADVHSFLSGRPWEQIRVERQTHPTHLETAIHWAVNEGRTAIALWGGDGSLSRAVNALSDLGALDSVAVMLVPVGTCNDFSRHFRLPDWQKLISPDGPLLERRVDVGVLAHAEGERIFVNNAGFGRRPEARRDRRPSPVADIFRMRAEPLDIVSQNGKTHEDKIDALMGIVFNAPYFGGGMHFDADIRSDDGQLDAYFVREQNRVGLLWSFIRGRSGRPFQNGNTTVVRGKTIRIRTSGELYPQADGESASKGAVKEINFSVRPGALRLLVPAMTASAQE